MIISCLDSFLREKEQNLDKIWLMYYIYGMNDIQHITVCFNLPEWVADKRFEHDHPHYNPPDNVYAGSYSYSTRSNQIEDGLFRLAGTDTTDLNPVSPCVHVEFDCKLEKLPKEIEKYRGKLQRFLGRFREGRNDG